MDSLCTPNQSLPLGSPVADTNRAGCSLVVHTCFPHHTRTPHRGSLPEEAEATASGAALEENGNGTACPSWVLAELGQ